MFLFFESHLSKKLIIKASGKMQTQHLLASRDCSKSGKNFHSSNCTSATLLSRLGAHEPLQ